jgi:hypothetical protein
LQPKSEQYKSTLLEKDNLDRFIALKHESLCKNDSYKKTKIHQLLLEEINTAFPESVSKIPIKDSILKAIKLH